MTKRIDWTRVYRSGITAFGGELEKAGILSSPQAGAHSFLKVASIVRIERPFPPNEEDVIPKGGRLGVGTRELIEGAPFNDQTVAYLAILQLTTRSSPARYLPEIAAFPDVAPWMLQHILTPDKDHRNYLRQQATSCVINGTELWMRKVGVGTWEIEEPRPHFSRSEGGLVIVPIAFPI
ncbi:MAG: hypothetical protein AB199_02070 [Parcubacteria bacterium C7867-004]|nr:MAG: hypothetical protein AB199_02070 [Parcubacteria bacterium C7867-004]